MKKVSVILTTYNGESSVDQVIDSILTQEGINQKFKIQLIVVDDCSTDNTLKIARKYDDAVVLTTKENSGGPNKGRNIGLRKVTGDYICIADQDDVWKKHKLISVLPHLEKVPVVTSGYTLINYSNEKKIDRNCENESGSIYFEKNRTFFSKLTKSLKGQNVYLGSIVYRKELNHILFEEVFGLIDYDWVLRIFYGRDSIEVCDSLYTRYVDGQNLSLDPFYRRVDYYYSLFFVERYMNEYPKEVKISMQRIHGSRARYFYLVGDMKNARAYFLRSQLNWKTVLYYFTTFIGSSFVKKHFNVFG